MSRISTVLSVYCVIEYIIAFSALTLLDGWQKWQPACKKTWVSVYIGGGDLTRALHVLTVDITDIIYCCRKFQNDFETLVLVYLGW